MGLRADAVRGSREKEEEKRRRRERKRGEVMPHPQNFFYFFRKSKISFVFKANKESTHLITRILVRNWLDLDFFPQPRLQHKISASAPG